MPNVSPFKIKHDFLKRDFQEDTFFKELRLSKYLLKEPFQIYNAFCQ